MEPTIENPEVPETAAAPPPTRRGITPLVTAGIAILALAVGGVIGVGIGWKVEQNRVKDDVKNIRPVGTVLAVTDDSITIKPSTGSGQREFALTDATVVDKAESGTTADINEGSTVFVRTRRGDSGKLEAAQIVVLPQGAPASGQ